MKIAIFSAESHGNVMTAEQFDLGEFDDCYRYELIEGVLIVSEFASDAEADANDELGHQLRTYQYAHLEGTALDCTLPGRIVKCGDNRRRTDRVIWAGLGRLPRKDETPTVIVEFVSGGKRDGERDYETKLEEYQELHLQEYWIIDLFNKTMTAHILDGGNYRKKILSAKQSYDTKMLRGFELPLARLFALADEWTDDTSENEL